MEDQDSRVRPMSEAENAAYRGVTVDEDGTAAEAESPRAEAYRSSGGAYERAQRSSVRYVRIGGAPPQPSLLSSLIWGLVLAALLAFIIFVALPAIAMVIVGVCILGAIVSLVGRGRVLAWLTRHLYGR